MFYQPLNLGQTLILNILDYQFRRKIVNPLRFCSFFQFYDIYSIYELFYIQYIASLLNIINMANFRFEIIKYKTQLLSCLWGIDGLQRIGQLCQLGAAMKIHVGCVCINSIAHTVLRMLHSEVLGFISLTFLNNLLIWIYKFHCHRSTGETC